MVHETMMPVNGIHMCVETFGEPVDPPLLLLAADASSMDWWDDEFCRRLAAGRRFVIRYDHRDTGRSTSYPAGARAYSGADLMYDALGVLDALRVPTAHLVGFSLGGALAQRIAVHHPSRVLTLTLMSTSVDGEAPARRRSFSAVRSPSPRARSRPVCVRSKRPPPPTRSTGRTAGPR
ncbi:alpha/beta fold hydrolase [Actinoplanes sp. CA-252034]|uniref:alpha/beta fold hydrolase n=1 Tax=Actinoplanes sp. CA-252034 TaxID=3239906 RepID=UPI003D97825E